MNDPTNKNEPFLSRWARRKQDASRGRTEDEALDEAQVHQEPEAIDAASTHDVDNEPELDLSKLPKAEELTAESDITAFLDKRVPAMLRNAALGRMWTLDPTIRDFIEVAENQWNWNVPGGAPFYEPIESVVESAGDVVAKAGNLSGNTVAQAFEGPSVVTSKEAAIARVDSQRVELKHETQKIEVKIASAAPQNDLHASEDDASFVAAIDDAHVSGTSSEAGSDAAPQHGIAQSLGMRRRHGGALPG